MKAPTALERRRREVARRRTKRRLVFVGLVLAPPVLAVGAAFSPVLDVDTIRVTGTKRVDVRTVLAIAGVERGQPLVTVDVDAVRRRLDKVAAIKRVTVRRAWPSGLDITVVERVPVVAVHRPDRYDLYDIDGVLVGSAPSQPAAIPPLKVTGDPPSDVVAATVSLLKALPATLRGDVRDLTAYPTGGLSFRLADGAVVLWGGADQTAAKVRALTLLVGQHAVRYDLRVPGRPAVVPRS